jgi:hypothetical protein
MIVPLFGTDDEYSIVLPGRIPLLLRCFGLNKSVDVDDSKSRVVNVLENSATGSH